VLPICVGHEIIGKVLRVGPQVRGIKPGDRVGVGAQVQSCMKCPQCKSDNENYCPHMVSKLIPNPTIDSLLTVQTPTAHHITLADQTAANL
jgi:D-arabinose 1-dehydrogenase-like Zn-dependent alcohol dehydrogenase